MQMGYAYWCDAVKLQVSKLRICFMLQGWPILNLVLPSSGVVYQRRAYFKYFYPIRNEFGIYDTNVRTSGIGSYLKFSFVILIRPVCNSASLLFDPIGE